MLPEWFGGESCPPLALKGYRCKGRLGCDTGMGLGQSAALGQRSLLLPCHPLNLLLFSVLPRPPAFPVKDPEKQTFPLSLVLAPGIPKHFLWAGL